MQIYLVGGAVRDALLGLPVKERDYVVVGATPEEMMKLGFKPVGKEFPVFLHPTTHEEYALARTERKIAKGYKGFEFYADPAVTLEEDLKRRDLTINAIAQTEDGQIIDPYHGQLDLKNKTLRHVSPAFSEDPVRILRLARFAARFSEFKVHPDTTLLMENMVKAGEVNALVPERVWQEFERALQENHPERFIEILKSCDALNILFPMISLHFDEIKKRLIYAAKIAQSSIIRFSVLFFGREINEIESLCDKYRIPTEYRELAMMQGIFTKQKSELISAEKILNLLEKLDAFRRPERFQNFLSALSLCLEDKKIISHLEIAHQASLKVLAKDFIQPQMNGEMIAKILREKRIAVIKNHLEKL